MRRRIPEIVLSTAAVYSTAASRTFSLMAMTALAGGSCWEPVAPP